ncbi:uncharacterized protein K444DRAFT_133250 [Hyaloscypha bicolor E]|uniref:Zn(2)-C6 fungal-type domain-containing protein n=1 Tax=Hyaloscypha bicolor E TaxID=1095630 RepID=A0A2J6STC0_9HELO|nr:uncharacterized protein K444DRAFT_133250 [Hyaloscypha bicolor E]PMD53989.1 hypothetical protein K444DRAFT_133250 [Hyaloscypha bicolor E]
MSSGSRGPASRSKRACRSCRKRHLKCDEQESCSNCQKSDGRCEYDEHEGFMAKQWSPGEAGLSRVELQEALSLVQGAAQSSVTAANTFINETQATASQYIITNSPAFASPGYHYNTPSPSAAPPRQHSIYSPSLIGTSPSATFVPSPRVERSRRIGLNSDLFYLDKYCHVIGPWFDLFDQEKNFSLVVPHLSLEHPLLQLSSLACASRQHHLTSSSSVDTTLTYYDDALQMLTASLRDESTSSSAAVFASCLFLAHCEMIGASTQDWHLHISGTYSLIRTHGWHGRSGELGQACFWIYCRMDLLSSLATGEQTRLDTSLWIPNSPSLPEVWTIDTWANHAVFILAQVHNFLCKIRQTPTFGPSLFDEWQSLNNFIDSHEQNQPSIFRPLVSLPPSGDNPFPSNFYISEAVSAALQMFDVARLLHILSRPERSRSERIARFQAQGDIATVYIDRIIANSIINRHDVNWATAVQLLSSAGHALVGWRKRKALLECLIDIQSRTGWNTRDNVNGLLEWWGWAGLLIERGWEWRDVTEEIGEEYMPGQALMRMFEWNLPGRNS